MANTYTQIHIHCIIAVQNRASLIRSEWKIDLYRYITGCIRNHDHKVLAINGIPDHIHVLFGHRPKQSLMDLIRIVKSNSSKWINENKFTRGKFEWQEGYGAFSYAKAECPKVINYINRQEEHHSKIHFATEYVQLLKEFEIDFDERYILKSIEQ